MALVSLAELADLSIGTPETGVVNFNALHALLHAIIKQLNLQDVKAEMCEETPKPLEAVPLLEKETKQRSDEAEDSPYADLEKKVIGVEAQVVGMTAHVHDVEAQVEGVKSQVHGIGEQVQGLEKQMAALEKLPSGTDLLERTKSGSPNGSTVADMWQMMQMKKKIEANENGISQAMTLFQDLLSEVNGMKTAHFHTNEGLQKLQERLGLNLPPDTQETGTQLQTCITDQKNLESDVRALEQRLSLFPSPEEMYNMVRWEVLEDCLMTGKGKSPPTEPHSADPGLGQPSPAEQPASAMDAQARKAPAAWAGAPGSQPGSPSSRASTPGTRAGITAAQTGSPGAQPGAPSVSHRTQPGATSGSPRTQPRTPGAQAGSPRAQTDTPVSQPVAQTGLPGTQTGTTGAQAGAQTGTPGAQAGSPRAQTDTPVSQPVAQTGLPGTQTGTTGAQAGAQAGSPKAQTGTPVSQPVAQPGFPGTQAGSPVAQPGAQAGSSGAQLGTQPGSPGAQASAPGVQLNFPGTWSSSPETQVEPPGGWPKAQGAQAGYAGSQGGPSAVQPPSPAAQLGFPPGPYSALMSPVSASQEKDKLPPSSTPQDSSGSSSASNRYSNTLEALRQIGQLSNLYTNLKEQIRQLEQIKCSHADLDKLQQFLSDAVPKNLSSMSADLMNQLSSLKALAEDMRDVKTKDKELLSHIQSTILQVQGDCENLNATTGSLIEDHRQKQKDIALLFQSLEKLEKEKADKERLETEIDVKADKVALAGKVSRAHFDAATEQLNKMMQDLLNKMSGQEQDWNKVLEKIFTEMDSKLDRLELDPFRQQLDERWKAIRKQLKERTPQYDADDAAGIRKRLMAHFHCISCDRPLEMAVPGPAITTVPSVPGLPSHRSLRPYTVYELEQVRQHTRNLRLGPSPHPRLDALRLESSVGLGKLHSVHSKMLMDIEKVQIHFGGSAKASSQMIREIMQSQCLSPGLHNKRDKVAEMAEYGYLSVPRHCGGSHTLTYPYRRYTRLQQIAQCVPMHPEETTMLAVMKHEEVDILGLDGHIYKGRMDARLPSISAKDGPLKAKSKLSCSSLQRQPPLRDTASLPARPHSAKLSSPSNSGTARSLKDRPLSSESRLSQADLARPSASTPPLAETREDYPTQEKETRELHLDFSMRRPSTEQPPPLQ
ncbi:glutamine-rich protein 2 isoform X4 [Carettochelys insculpta]|uniref:glutamine-rich protein 2 isoform X4 n=1 Tax=Carettochelys insculpta TaxID=44489 RepID=UPI003EBEBD8B